MFTQSKVLKRLLRACILGRMASLQRGTREGEPETPKDTYSVLDYSVLSRY